MSQEKKSTSDIDGRSSRLFQPMILQTKEELRTALQNGMIKSSKYNLLNDTEKMFVELVCFGGYTGEQAVRAINPSIRSPLAIANKMLANPDVAGCIDELTVAKDKKFQAELSSAKEMALNKLLYIMGTSDDEALVASCAKVILDKGEAAMKQATQKDEPVGQVRFQIEVNNVYNGQQSPKSDEPVIIELSPTEMDKGLKESAKEIDDQREKVGLAKSASIDPNTGLQFTLNYEGVDNYH